MSDDKNPFPNENNTGHIWDENLRELTNEIPTWWRIGFHASWILVVVYTILYPSWPLINSHYEGVMGWTSIGEYKEDMAEIEQVRAKYEQKLPEMSASAILADDELSQYVVRSAKVLFGDNCAACHGTGGAGNPTYPILADDDWIYGGSIDNIVQSITNGRQGVMPAHSAQLNESETDALAKAILSGNPNSDPNFLAKGCIACHGMDAKGSIYIGGVNLTDSIWRFAEEDQLASIKYTITHGVNFQTQDPKSRNAVMPKFGGGKLSETNIKKLAVYVHKLGGGQ